MAVLIGCSSSDPEQNSSTRSDSAQSDGDYDVAVYYFPQYHTDRRNEQMFGAGWSEWYLVNGARPRFEGHLQPRIPTWVNCDQQQATGYCYYEDEADPRVMAKKIAAAADHGVTQFIFDWYWYNGEPFLYRALDEGFLQAENRNRLEFALMWANHDWMNLYPAPKNGNHQLLFPGGISAEDFDFVCDYIIEFYFKEPNYWKVDGAPYFSIYELHTFAAGLGGLNQASDALWRFREKVKAAGFRDLHLNVVVRDGDPISPNDTVRLGASSVTHYTWVHFLPQVYYETDNRVPWAFYEPMVEDARNGWPRVASQYSVPYFPNVMAGWDSSPRTDPNDSLTLAAYPYFPIVVADRPEFFKRSLQHAKEYLDASGERTLTINAWNEWTEGSYLEPDDVSGMRKLEAIRDVFGN